MTLLCDNKNLASDVDSADPRVTRWKADVMNAPCVVRHWIPGEINTIADYASRIAVSDPSAPLDDDERFEMRLFALHHLVNSEGEGGALGSWLPDDVSDPVALPPEYVPPRAVRHLFAITDAVIAADHALDALDGEGEETGAPLVTGAPTAGATAPPLHAPVTVPGHLSIGPLLNEILDAQDAAPPEERASWTGSRYSTAKLGGRSLQLFDDRSLVPQGATAVKQKILRLAHDVDAHFRGAERMLWQLRHTARVYWKGMDEDARKYVNSCFRCQFAKAPHSVAKAGQLNPTIAPHVHHTW